MSLQEFLEGLEAFFELALDDLGASGEGRIRVARAELLDWLQQTRRQKAEIVNHQS